MNTRDLVETLKDSKPVVGEVTQFTSKMVYVAIPVEGGGYITVLRKPTSLKIVSEAEFMQ